MDKTMNEENIKNIIDDECKKAAILLVDSFNNKKEVPDFWKPEFKNLYNEIAVSSFRQEILEDKSEMEKYFIEMSFQFHQQICFDSHELVEDKLGFFRWLSDKKFGDDMPYFKIAAYPFYQELFDNIDEFESLIVKYQVKDDVFDSIIENGEEEIIIYFDFCSKHPDFVSESTIKYLKSWFLMGEELEIVEGYVHGFLSAFKNRVEDVNTIALQAAINQCLKYYRHHEFKNGEAVSVTELELNVLPKIHSALLEISNLVGFNRGRVKTLLAIEHDNNIMKIEVSEDSYEVNKLKYDNRAIKHIQKSII